MAKHPLLKSLLSCDKIKKSRRGDSLFCFFNLFLCLLFFFTAFKSYAQGKYDNIWIIGHGGEGTIFDFANDTVTILYENIDMYHYAANVSICDSLGSLLFYSNGIYIANTNGDLMSNGNNIDLGLLAGSSLGGVNVPQIILILPKPNSNNLFYIFYKSLNHLPNNMGYYTNFLYSVLKPYRNNNRVVL